MDKHREPVNFIDFKEKNALCASCSDDQSVIIYNYVSYRQESILAPHEQEVKICKFLGDFDCLASCDMGGNIYFWGVTPSPRKEKLLCQVQNVNDSEIGPKATFSIRGVDFDNEDMLLFTGDEMGFLNIWDCSKLLTKLEDVKVREAKSQPKSDFLTEVMKKKQTDTFVTGVEAEGTK